MARHQLWLGDKNNEDYGVVVGDLRISAPVPEVDTIHVPGRSGDLHVYTGAYKNRTGTASAYIYRTQNVKAAVNSVQNWLLGTQGYRRLEMDDDVYHFMMARVVNGAEIAARLDKLAPFTIQLDLKPQRYFKSGASPVVINGNGNLNNLTLFTAEPLYEITGDGTVTISVGSSEIAITGLGVNAFPRTIFFDAETQNAYTADGEEVNARVETSGDMKLKPGDNVVTVTGSLESMKVTPRWWEL